MLGFCLSRWAARESSLSSDSADKLGDVYQQEVSCVRHYTDRLFMFRTTRARSFRFRSGEFVMLSLKGMDPLVYRAYSMASPSWDDELEFFSIKVSDGALTRHLQNIKIGDTIALRKKPTGTLVLDALRPGRRLYLFSTGTGIAPFASLIRDPQVYENFEQVILTHSCREAKELTYGEELVAGLRSDPLIGSFSDRLFHYTSVTQEDFVRRGRITELFRSGRLFEDLGLSALDPGKDRAMICGSMAMIKEMKVLCQSSGLIEGSNSAPATFVVERAFVG